MARQLTTSKLLEYLSSPIVKLYVGADRKEFSVHKNLICSVSSVFAVAFNGHFRERSGHMYLREVRPRIFELFLVWLYDRSIGLAQDDRWKLHHREAAELYRFGDFIDCNALKDRSMDELQDAVARKHDNFLGIDDIHALLDNTPDSCALRKFVVAYMIHSTAAGLLGAKEDCKKIMEERPELRSIYWDILESIGWERGRLIDYKPTLRRCDRCMGFKKCCFHAHPKEETSVCTSQTQCSCEAFPTLRQP